MRKQEQHPLYEKILACRCANVRLFVYSQINDVCKIGLNLQHQDLDAAKWGNLQYNIANVTTSLVKDILPNKLISRRGEIPWPSCSPDYFLLGYLDSWIYLNIPVTIPQIMRNIRQKIIQYLLADSVLFWFWLFCLVRDD